MDQHQEREIIERVLGGDKQVFVLLIEKYKNPVFNLAFRMTGSYADADDLTQETFLRAYRQLAKFHPEKKFFTWLYTISINLIRNHLKKKAKDMALLSDDVLNDAAFDLETDREPLQDDTAERIEVGLLNLPVHLREAIILKFRLDLTFEEMSSVTGHSVSALKMRVYRGLEKLKKKLENGK